MSYSFAFTFSKNPSICSLFCFDNYNCLEIELYQSMVSMSLVLDSPLVVLMVLSCLGGFLLRPKTTSPLFCLEGCPNLLAPLAPCYSLGYAGGVWLQKGTLPIFFFCWTWLPLQTWPLHYNWHKAGVSHIR